MKVELKSSCPPPQPKQETFGSLLSGTVLISTSTAYSSTGPYLVVGDSGTYRRLYSIERGLYREYGRDQLIGSSYRRLLPGEQVVISADNTTTEGC